MEKDLTEILKESSRGRAAFYEYLSLVFERPPDKKFKGISARMRDFFQQYGEETDNILILEGVKDLDAYIHLENNSDELLIRDMLNVLYTHTFLLGMNSIPMSESVHRSPDRLIKQEPWEKVLVFYHRRGFKKPFYFKEPEDHVAMELLFMKQMCELTAHLLEEEKDDKLEAVFEEQYEFLNEHINKWIPGFADMIINRSQKDDIPLYKGAAKLLKGFLEQDAAMLKELTSEKIH